MVPFSDTVSVPICSPSWPFVTGYSPATSFAPSGNVTVTLSLSLAAPSVSESCVVSVTSLIDTSVPSTLNSNSSLDLSPSASVIVTLSV